MLPHRKVFRSTPQRRLERAPLLLFQRRMRVPENPFPPDIPYRVGRSTPKLKTWPSSDAESRLNPGRNSVFPSGHLQLPGRRLRMALEQPASPISRPSEAPRHCRTPTIRVDRSSIWKRPASSLTRRPELLQAACWTETSTALYAE